MKSPNLELLNLSIFFSLVKLVFRVWASVSDWDWQTDDHNRWAQCTKRTAIKPGFQTISKQQAAHAHAIFVTRLTQSHARVCQNRTSEAKRALVAGCEIVLSWCETKKFHPKRTCISLVFSVRVKRFLFSHLIGSKFSKFQFALSPCLTHSSVFYWIAQAFHTRS